jgi:phenylpropionate dioxygenase-like ring-hydroxylating dioxygenase large terminal subunit
MNTLWDIAYQPDALPALSPRALEDRIVNEGMRGRWYPILGTERFGAEPVAVERMGIRLVIWRDAAGKVNVQRDRCPHRGARLSQGTVDGNTIVCPYHGIRIDERGCIAKVPALPGSPIEGRFAVETFAAFELGDAVFVYFPLPGETEPTPFTAPFEFAAEEYSHFLCETTWKANYRYVLDNLMDIMHGSYLHAGSYTLGYGSKEDTLLMEETPTGFIVRRAIQKDVNFDWTEFGDTGGMWWRLDIPYPASAGPGGPLRIVGFITPIDEHNTEIFFWRMRNVSGADRENWRKLFKSDLEAKHWFVLEQDRVALEALADDARQHEILYQHDIGVTRLRKWMSAKARADIAHARACATLKEANG